MGLKEKLQMARLSILASIAPAMVFCNSLIVQAAETTDTATGGAAVVQKIGSASDSIYQLIKDGTLVLIGVVIAICGAILIFGTDKMKESVKERGYQIVIGMALVFFAGEIALFLERIFG